MRSNTTTGRKNSLTGGLAVLVLSCMMLAGGMFGGLPSTDAAYAADQVSVASWADLQSAIAGGASDIVITKDLYAEESIAISGKVTISGGEGRTIYQKKRDGDTNKYQTMFVVGEGGDLTLGGNLTLSGKIGCAGGGGDTGAKTAAFKFPDNKYLYVNSSGTLSKFSSASTFKVDEQGYLTYNGNYIGLDNGQYSCSSAIVKDNAVRVLKNGTVYDGLNTTDDYGLYAAGKYLMYNSSSEPGIFVPAENYQTVIPDNAVKAENIQDAPGSGNQGCDGPSCSIYTKQTFAGGEVGKPKGFFVQVNAGGKATLAGATLEHFYTSTVKDHTIKHAAPVAAYGGTFDIASGSIKNNVVGYIAKDSMSNSDANAIKQYIKGAAPNAPRVGDLAKSSNRRNRPAGIDGDEKASGITGTAGAVIYSNGAKGTVSGGIISYNRGDTGGIMVSGEGTAVDIIGADVSVDHNVGVQFGGGSFVEDGGFLGMSAGTMSENVAWFGGGAVFATENGIAWLTGKETDYGERKDGMFTLNGGTLDNNTAFTRGGAILADSDGVALIKGTLSNNKSRMLGGAVYVMGDDPRYTYLMYIENGYVHDNKAVTASQDRGTPATALTDYKEENMALSKILNSAEPCSDSAPLFGNDMTKNSDDMVDGRGNDGTGGGIWLCAYGNTNLNLAENEFVVNRNFASGSVVNNYNGKENQATEGTSSGKTGGNDIHKDTMGPGNVVFSGISQSSGWMDENNGKNFAVEYPPQDGVIKDYGQRNLVYTGSAVPSGDIVEVTGNLSRRGGGLAADGTFVFGKARNVADIYAEMEIEKTWANGIEPEDIVVRVYAEKGGKKYFVQDVPLTETAPATSEPTSELDTVFPEADYKARFAVPITVEDEEGKVIQVFEPKIGDKTYNLNNDEDLAKLAEAIKGGTKPTLDTSTVKFVFEEGTYDDDGKFVRSDKYNFISDNVVVDTAKAEIYDHTQQTDSSGNTNPVLEVSNSAIYMKNPVINDRPAEIEKYVNEAVHKAIAVDEVFKYDILAYVSMDADKVTITDQLVEELEFVSGEGDVKVADLGTSNNHKVTNNVDAEQVNDDATVAEEGEAIEEKTVSIDGKKLTVTLDDGVTVKSLRGHWIKVSFSAQINSDLQEKIKSGEVSINSLPNIRIKPDEVYKADPSIYPEEGKNRPAPNVGNAPVDSEEDHGGIVNTASYVIEVLNEGRYMDESNTVTVKPEEPEVEKYVSQAVHKNIALDEVFTYDIIGYISRDADEVIFEDKLVNDLEFVDKEDISVMYHDGNNHKPKYDVEGKAIDGNGDATVASDSWTDVPDDGLSIVADETTGELKVTIDDRETVMGLRGKYVKVSFKAQIKKSLQDAINAGEKTLADLSAVTVKADENDPVVSDEAHKGIKNDATMKILVGNEGKYDLKSNTVTVKPEQPEIEKYVNQAVHDFIDLDEVFTYDIIAFVTRDADKVTITDSLDPQLEFVSGESDVRVADLGEDDNHKVTNNIRAEQVNDDATVAGEGAEIEKRTVAIEGNDLTITLDDEATVKALRGHWIRVTFDAKIKEGLSVDDLKYTAIDAAAEEDRAAPNIGNAPLVSKESHSGVPNKARYTIGVKTEAEIIEDKHEDESNTVTVKPEEFDVEISKRDLEGSGLSGAGLTVTDESGKEVGAWTSEESAHKIKVKPGKYVLTETEAPAGYNRITTPVEFEVDEDGKVTLLTTKVDRGGGIELSGTRHLILTDATRPTISKTVNGGDNVELTDPAETFAYTITAKIAYLPDESFVITDDVPEELEIADEGNIAIKVNGEALGDDAVEKILTIDGNTITVSPTVEMMKAWGPFEMSVTFSCRLKDAEASKGKSIKNVAVLKVDDETVKINGDGNEATVQYLPGEEEENGSTPQDEDTDRGDDADEEKDRSTGTGDSTSLLLLITLLTLSGAAASLIGIRRRRMTR